MLYNHSPNNKLNAKTLWKTVDSRVSLMSGIPFFNKKPANPTNPQILGTLTVRTHAREIG